MAKKIKLNWGKITETIKNGDNKTDYNKTDERFFTPKLKDDGTAQVIIRFLWNKNTEELPFIQTYGHGYKNEKNKWFIEDCPTSIKKQCPVYV